MEMHPAGPISGGRDDVTRPLEIVNYLSIFHRKRLGAEFGKRLLHKKC